MHVRSLGLRRPTYSQLLKYVCIYVCKRSCQTLFRGLSTRASRKPFLLSLSLFSRSLSARRCSLTRRFTDLLVNGTPFSCTRGGNRLHSLLDAIQTVCAGEDTSFVRLVDFFFWRRIFNALEIGGTKLREFWEPRWEKHLLGSVEV